MRFDLPPGRSADGIAASLGVVVIDSDGTATAVPGLVASLSDTGLVVSAMDSVAAGSGNLDAPAGSGRVFQITLGAIESADAAEFDIEFVESAVVIRPRSELASRMLNIQRNQVIAMALAEINRQLLVPLTDINTVFIQQ